MDTYRILEQREEETERQVETDREREGEKERMCVCEREVKSFTLIPLNVTPSIGR